MQFSLSSLPILALAALSPTVNAAPAPEPEGFLIARDVCGGSYPAYTRRIGSPCAGSNGNHQFCSCDRTNIARCEGGKWVDGKDCEKENQECIARLDGANAQCL